MSTFNTLFTSKFNDNIYTPNITPIQVVNWFSISPTQKLIIPKNYTLDILANGGEIDNSGAIINYGTLTIDGSLNSSGIINNDFGGDISNNGTINNTGTFINRGTITGNYVIGNAIINKNGGV